VITGITMVEDYTKKEDEKRKEKEYENPLKTEKEIAVKELDEMNLLPFAIPRKVEQTNIQDKFRKESVMYLEDKVKKKKKEEK